MYLIKIMLKFKQKGFTLLELLLVIALIAILSTFVIATGRESFKRGRDTQRKSDIKNVASALDIFYSDYGIYPASDGAGAILACPYSAITSSGTPCVWGTSEFSDDQGTIYFNRLPTDPDESQSYYYEPSATQDSFVIYTDLEIEGDADSAKLGCTGGTCSGHDYFVKSSNQLITH